MDLSSRSAGSIYSKNENNRNRLNKTGTTSLGVCLNHLGFNHISFSETAFNLYIKGNYKSLLNLVGEYDSFEDWPWPLIYKKLIELFVDQNLYSQPGRVQKLGIKACANMLRVLGQQNIVENFMVTRCHMNTKRSIFSSMKITTSRPENILKIALKIS